MQCHCNDGDPVAPAVPAHSQSDRLQSPSSAKSWRCRITALIQWALPVTALALIPKCPACVAAYVLIFTGLGLSIPAASAVRWTLIFLSITAIAWLIFRAARRLLPTLA